MKHSIKKMFIGIGLSTSCILSATLPAMASSYTVQSGDTLWKISQKYNVSLPQLMEVNKKTEQSILFIGDQLIIPDGDNYFDYIVKSGDTPWKISNYFGVSLTALLEINNLTETSYIYINQKLKIPIDSSLVTASNDSSDGTSSSSTNESTDTIDNTSTSDTGGSSTGSADSTGTSDSSNTTGSTTTDSSSTASQAPYNTYENYTVKSGDNFWSIGVKFGIPTWELLSANDATSSTMLSIGQIINIPVHHVPVLDTPGPQYGEYLDWWTSAQYVIPIGSVFKVVDFYTGKSFMAKRTIGANHSDTETLTSLDTAIMKEIWGGNFSWISRPVIIEFNNRKIAASASIMPHAGNDSAPANDYTTWRSGDYGPGPNYDFIKGNDMDGHFDIHFLNSTKHVDGQLDPAHQANVKIAAGMN